MSLRVRTFLAFGLVLLVTLGLGIFALYQLVVVDAASTELGGKAMPSLFQSSQTLRMVINFRREEANRLLSVADEDRTYREKLMNDYSNQAKAFRAQYRPVTREEQEAVGTFDTLWPKFLESTAALVAALRKD